MKKILSLVLVAVLLVGTMLTLASCGTTISGTYQDALKVTTFKFSGSKVTLTVDNIIGDDTVLEGKYEITEKDDGSKEITFTFDSEDKEAEKWSEPLPFSEGEENGKKFIKISIVKYTEVE